MARLFRGWLVLFLVASMVLAGGCGSDDDPELPLEQQQDPPVVEIRSAPSSLTNDRSATFEFECLDDRSCEFRCRLNEDDAQNCESPVEYEGLDDGDHVFEIVAIDEDELESEPVRLQWTVDTEKPRVIDLVGPEEYTDQTDATLSFGCSKHDCSFECSLDDQDFEACESPVTYSELEDGSYRLSVRATDAIGNVGPAETHEWTVDTISPLVQNLEGPSDPTNSTDASFDFECSKDECSFQCQLDGSEMEPCAPGVNYDDLDDGVHTFVVVATDALGNVGPPVVWTWTVDTEEPAIKDLSGPPDPTNQTTAQLDFRCSKDDCQFSCQLSGASQGTVVESASCDPDDSYPDLLDDDYTFTVTATDPAGNTSDVATWEWTVDTEKPVIEELSGPDDPTNQTTAELDFACSKDDCEFSCQLSGASQGTIADSASCDPGDSYPGLFDDDYTFTVTATDPAGNTSDAATWEWTVDTEEPILAILEAPPMEITDDWATFEFECANKPGCTFECTLDYDDGSGSLQTGSAESCSSPHTIDDLEPGSYALTIEAIDEAGNRDEETLEWTVYDWSAITAGLVHTCALDADGSLWCWGANFWGQLGLGDEEHQTSPKQVASGTEWTNISAGQRHTCGVQVDGSLWCWGDGSSGKLGLGDDDDRLAPEQVGSGTDWVGVAAGSGHTCGVREDGSLWCWGDGSSGQLGLGDDDERLAPEQVAGATDWERVSTGGDTTCGVQVDGSLWCWGEGSSGQLGLGDTDHRLDPEQVMGGTDWERVSVGGDSTCGVQADASLWCWGDGSSGQLGLGDDDDRLAPEQVGSDTDWKMVSSGEDHTCGVREDESLWCWGQGALGQLGLGDEYDRNTPGEVDTGSEWEDISVGSEHSCGVRDGGGWWCWGSNWYGETGLGYQGVQQLTPEAMGDGELYSVISAAYYHACGVGVDGSLRCWGEGSDGRLGLGDEMNRQTPHQTGSDTDWEEVSSGTAHTCGLRDDGTLWCWGLGDWGQLGLGDDDERLTPHQVGSATNWETISTGASSTCGVREDGSLWCWGRGSSGRLGLGDTDQRLAPEQVGSDTDWETVSVGGEHACGLRDDGSLWCWGNGSHGRLGLGDTDNELTPQQVGSDTDWEHVSTGGQRTCGLRDDGTLWCWGSGWQGRLGLGDEDNRLAPEQVGSDTDWESVSSGGAHGCGIREDGTLWCWGNHYRVGLGELDDHQLTPQQVGSATDWESVSAARMHTHAIRSSGEGWSWGVNSEGRLGNGTRWDNEPQPVVDP